MASTPGRMAVELGQVAQPRPAAIAVHDDRDVGRQLVRRDERGLGRSLMRRGRRIGRPDQLCSGH